jgi:hypothetical protein
MHEGWAGVGPVEQSMEMDMEKEREVGELEIPLLYK